VTTERAKGGANLHYCFDPDPEVVSEINFARPLCYSIPSLLHCIYIVFHLVLYYYFHEERSQDLLKKRLQDTA
jgi:hypothetical protein